MDSSRRKRNDTRNLSSPDVEDCRRRHPVLASSDTKRPERARIRLGSLEFNVELATCPDAHTVGLSKHAHLDPNEGMLFLFEKQGSHTFWMSEVPFPIDIIGLDSESRITRIVEGAQPGSYERWTFPNVQAVLEVPALSCRRAQVKAGHRVVASDTGVHEYSSTADPYVEDENAQDYFHELWGDELADSAMDDDLGEPVTRHAFAKQARTLWHGTSKENAEQIKQRGLIPQVGPWVQDSYGFDPGNKDDEIYGHLDSGAFDVTFAADKGEISKALGGIIAAVAHKLGKSFHDVTDDEIIAHGALIKIKDGDEYMEHRPNKNAPQDEQDAWERANSDAPPSVEPGDWWSRDSVNVDEVITGPAMIRVLRQNGIWPRIWGGEQNSRLKGIREVVIKYLRQKNPAWTQAQVLSEVSKLSAEELQDLGYEAERYRKSKQAQIVDEDKFITKVARILLQVADRMEWQPDYLNGKATERSVVSRRTLASWLGSAVQDQSELYILEAAGTEQGLQLVGDALVIAGLADFTRTGFQGKQPTLVAYRSTASE